MTKPGPHYIGTRFALLSLPGAIAFGLAFFVLPIIAIPSVNAVTRNTVWQGGQAGDWSVANNWNPTAAYPKNNPATSIDYIVTISGAAVNLTENVTVSRLTLTDSSLSGPFTIATSSGTIRLTGANTLANPLVYQTTYPIVFLDSTARLTNHGTVEFRTSFDQGIGVSRYGTLINATDGRLRLNPAKATEIGDAYTLPFYLENEGEFLADNLRLNSVYAPVNQSATGTIRVTGTGTGLQLFKGATLAGYIEVAPGSTFELSTPLYPYGETSTYSIEKLSITGLLKAGAVKLEGVLEAGNLVAENSIIVGEFINNPNGILSLKGVDFADASSSLGNHGIVELYTHDHFGHEQGKPKPAPVRSIITNYPGGVVRMDPASMVSIIPDWDGSTQSYLQPFAFVNQGTLLINNGFTNSLPIRITNQNLIHVTTGSSLLITTNDFAFRQTGGETRVENARLGSDDFMQMRPMLFLGGMLRATGRIDSYVYLRDTTVEIGSGRSVGSLALGVGRNSFFDLDVGSKTHFDLAGITPRTGHDFIISENSIALGGELVLHLTPAFAATLNPSDSMTIVSGSALHSTFSNVQSGGRLMVANGTGSFLVTVTETELRVGDFIPSGFLNALVAAAVPIEDRTPTADPDHDGRPNLLEYALGLEPMASDPTTSLTVWSEGGKLNLRYRRLRPELGYQVQACSDLASADGWSTVGVDQGDPDSDNQVTASVNLEDSEQRFLRLVVTPAPASI